MTICVETSAYRLSRLDAHLVALVYISSVFEWCTALSDELPTATHEEKVDMMRGISAGMAHIASCGYVALISQSPSTHV
jgi:hypothetical protein